MPILITDLTKESREEFLDSVRENSPRKEAALRREKIMAESFDDLVMDRINEIYTDPMIKSQLGRFAQSSFINPLKNITDRLAVAYKDVPPRTLEGDASDDDNTNFQQLIFDGRITIEAKKWLKWALVSNVVIVVPQILDRMRPRLKWRMYLPSESEVITAQDDPHEVDVLGYRIQGDWVGIIDAAAFYVYDELNKLRELVPHDLGVFPGTIFRLDDPVMDFWSSTRGDSMVKATIEISHLMAVMAWVRKGQNRKGLFIAAEDLNKALSEGQLMLAEKPIEVNADPSSFKFEALDMVTAIKEFDEHIRLIYHEVAEQNGLPSFMVDFPSSAAAQSNNGFASAQQHAHLDEIRQDHIEFLRISERDLMIKTSQIAKAGQHLNAVDPKLVVEDFRIVWPPLTFIDDPLRKLDNWKKKIELNVGFSQVDVVMELFPGITRQRAGALIERGIEERKLVADFHAENNLSADANMGTIAQVNGQEGGQASTPPPQDEEEDV